MQPTEAELRVPEGEAGGADEAASIGAGIAHTHQRQRRGPQHALFVRPRCRVRCTETVLPRATRMQALGSGLGVQEPSEGATGARAASTGAKAASVVRCPCRF